MTPKKSTVDPRRRLTAGITQGIKQMSVDNAACNLSRSTTKRLIGLRSGLILSIVIYYVAPIVFGFISSCGIYNTRARLEIILNYNCERVFNVKKQRGTAFEYT